MNLVKKYSITLAIGFLIVLMIITAKDIFVQTEAVKIFHILCDAFFAVGVTITGFGLLVFTSNEGVFDGLVYGVSSFINMFRKNNERKYKNLYDYKESRADKKMSFGFLVICGLIFLSISMIMYLCYSRCV